MGKNCNWWCTMLSLVTAMQTAILFYIDVTSTLPLFLYQNWLLPIWLLTIGYRWWLMVDRKRKGQLHCKMFFQWTAAFWFTSTCQLECVCTTKSKTDFSIIQFMFRHCASQPNQTTLEWPVPLTSVCLCWGGRSNACRRLFERSDHKHKSN